MFSVRKIALGSVVIILVLTGIALGVVFGLHPTTTSTTTILTTTTTPSPLSKINIMSRSWGHAYNNPHHKLQLINNYERKTQLTKSKIEFWISKTHFWILPSFLVFFYHVNVKYKYTVPLEYYSKNPFSVDLCPRNFPH